MTGTGRSRTAASTIVARNYLPAARVLADSYIEHHPGADFCVLVVDALPGELPADPREPDDGVTLLTPADLDFEADDFERMATAYTAIELCTAVKPWLMRHLLRDHEVAIYLDPDIEVFAPFADDICEHARAHGIVLTPHVLAPVPRDGLRPSENDLMLSGVFNLGFIALTSQAGPFIDEWETRLRQDAIVSPAEQLFFDQRWIDNVPAMFDHHVVTDPGCNVAYWNVYQRLIERGPDGTLTAGGSPLRFMHFSGYRPEKPWLISVHYADLPRVLLSEEPLLRELADAYRDKLIERGYAGTVDSVPYRWGSLPDGTNLPVAVRRAFRLAWIDAERRGDEPPSGAFSAAGASDFLAWATQPADADQARAGLNPWMLAIWHGREDIRAAFPDPLGANAIAFREWCKTAGVASGEIPPTAIADREGHRQIHARSETGVNLLGYLTTESGVGELSRALREVVEASGVRYAVSVEETSVINRTGHAFEDDRALRDPEFGISLVCVNADMTDLAKRRYPEFFRGRYVIGVWSWELSDFPWPMHAAFEHVDEIWANSEFTARAISAVSPPVPVFAFPIPVREPEPIPARTSDGKTRFLFMFDYNSLFERKNPISTVQAFQTAFPGRDDVALVIKSINGDRHASDRERLRAVAAGDSRIELMDEYLDREEIAKLFSTADCYVSLHRAEGFGFTIAEAMSYGLPVVSTDYSSTTELLGPSTGWPVAYRLVSVGSGSPPYPADAHWAEPDLEAAARALREVADDPAEARRRGAMARSHILGERSVAAAARWVRDRVEAVHGKWLEEDTPTDTDEGPLGAVRMARHALHTRPDIDTPSRMPFAKAYRKAILRVLDHHDHHQRYMLNALCDAVEGSVGSLTERLERLEYELSIAREKLAAAEHHRDQSSVSNAQRIDAVDRKLVDLVRSSDQRHDYSEQAVADLRADLQLQIPALLNSVTNLYDRLRPPPDEPSTAVPTDVGLLRLPADDNVMLPWLRHYGTWEVEESLLVDMLLPPGGVFVDIGAHVGYFTIRALRRVGGDGAVIAVEPWDRVRQLLTYNVAANVPDDVASALTIVEGAAWDENTTLRFAPSTEGNSGDNRIADIGPVEVRGVRLGDLDALAGRRIDVVKCDAQGFDQRALAGMTSLFAEQRPHIVCEFDPAAIESAGDDAGSVLATYRSWGYAPTIVTPAVIDTVRVNGIAETLSDEQVIAAAASAPDGFVTVWLQGTHRR